MSPFHYSYPAKLPHLELLLHLHQLLLNNLLLSLLRVGKRTTRRHLMVTLMPSILTMVMVMVAMTMNYDNV